MRNREMRGIMHFKTTRGLSNIMRVSLVCALAATCVTGCGVVSELAGVEFETSYSPQQKEVFSASFLISMRLLVGEDYSLTRELELALFDVAEVLCADIDDNGRDAAKQSLLTQMSEMAPETANADILSEKYSEVLILASTAQGSFCPDSA